MQEDPSFSAAFELRASDVYQTSVYPRFPYDKSPAPPPSLPDSGYAPPPPPPSAHRNASPSPSLLPVPSLRLQEHYSVRSASVTRDSVSEAGGTALNIQSPLDFFEPRPTQSLLSLYEDDELRVPVVSGIPKPPFPEETSKPNLRTDIPLGAQGIWSVLKWLLAECQITFAQRLFHGSLVIAPGALTRAVFEHVADNSAFCDLYTANCQTAMAAHLAGGARRNTTWDFKVNTITNNPLVRVLFKWVKVFARELGTRFITGVRHDTAWIVTRYPTLGAVLPPNELSGCSAHVHPPNLSAEQARKIQNKIHPAQHFSDGDPDKPNDQVVDKAMIDYLSTPSVEYVAHSIVSRLDRTNVALASRATLKDEKLIKMPQLIIPLAATFVETELLTVREARYLPNGKRVALPETFTAISQAERGKYKVFHQSWGSFVAAGETSHVHKDAAIRLVSNLERVHNLTRVFADYMERREAQAALQIASHGPYGGLGQLEG